MPQDTLNEREFELVNIIGAEIASNQRDLSHHMSLSLGTTNMLIRRLISKGYIRIKQLNQRKVEYMLTPKGFAEKVRKSIKYTVKTINSIGLIKENLKKVFLNLQKKGERDFVILGDSDLVILVDSIIKEVFSDDCKISRIKQTPTEKIDEFLLICTENVDGNLPEGIRSVDLIRELSKDSEFINYSINQKDQLA